MLERLSDLNMNYRWDFDILYSGLISECVTGTWLSITTGGTVERAWRNVPSSGIATVNAYQIWNENATNVAGAFSPDVTNTQHFTLTFGKYRARTDRFVETETAAVGRYLCVARTQANAGLAEVRSWANLQANEFPLAHIINVTNNVTYRGVTYSRLVEYVTINT